jgi:CCR4-NOT transcription complex subunit 1
MVRCFANIVDPTKTIFVAENHFQFCKVIPAQLRNFVLTSYPSSFHKLHYPFREGLKIKRLEEMREAPKIAADIVTLF